MKAISIPGPWWWFALSLPEEKRPGLLNMNWTKLTPFRGWLLIHAAPPWSKSEFEDVCEFARRRGVWQLPSYETIPHDGIVGSVRVLDCVSTHPSRWFIGPTALVIDKEYPLPFQPYPGSLGFFEIENRVQTCVQTPVAIADCGLRIADSKPRPRPASAWQEL